MNSEFNNINPSSNVPNQTNNYPNNQYGYPNVSSVQNYQQQQSVSATPQYSGSVQQTSFPQQPQPVIQVQSTYPQQSQVQPVQQVSYTQPSSAVVAATPSYQQQSSVPNIVQPSYQQSSQVQSQQQVSYTQQSQPFVQAQSTYPQQTQVGPVQQASYAQPSTTPVITASSQMPQNIQSTPTMSSQQQAIQPQTQMSQQIPQMQSQVSFEPVAPTMHQDTNMTVNDLQVGQIPVSSSNMTSGINNHNIFNNNNQLPVQFSATNNEVEHPKKSIKDKLSFLKNKKVIALGIILIVIVVALIFGVNKLLSGSFGHGYSVDEGTKININETTSSKNKYKFSVDIVDVKDISIAKTKYKGYKLAITNTGSGKLKLDGFDIEFTIKNKDGEITSTTVFLSNSYMSLAPDSYDIDLLPLEVPHGKTVEGYIYFKTAIEDIETFEVNVYRNVSGKKASYKINFKQPDEEEPDEESEENEELDEDEESQEDEDITSNENDVSVSTDKNKESEESNSNSSKVDDKKETDNKADTKKKNTE